MVYAGKRRERLTDSSPVLHICRTPLRSGKRGAGCLKLADVAPDQGYFRAFGVAKLSGGEFNSSACAEYHDALTFELPRHQSPQVTSHPNVSDPALERASLAFGTNVSLYAPCTRHFDRTQEST